MQDTKNKYIIKASDEAIELIKNSLAEVEYKSILLNNTYIIESNLDKEFFGDIKGVDKVEDNYKGTFSLEQI